MKDKRKEKLRDRKVRHSKEDKFVEMVRTIIEVKQPVLIFLMNE